MTTLDQSSSTMTVTPPEAEPEGLPLGGWIVLPAIGLIFGPISWLEQMRELRED